MANIGARHRPRRVTWRSTLLGAGVAMATVLVAAGCVPTSPGPEVRDQELGRGIVSGVDVAPSSGCVDDPGGVPDSGGVPDPGSSPGIVRMTIDGAPRTAMVRVPERPGPHPLLVSLHPFTQGPDAWEDYSGLADAAVERGYVVASPTGSDPGPRWAVPGGLEAGADDVGFVAELADHLEDTLCIDRNSEFAAGYSAGAAMAQALSCTMPWRFAAVAGSGGMNLTETCPGASPTDVLTMHGSADPVAPPTGSQIVFAPPTGLHIDTVVAVNARRAGCELVPGLSTPVAGVRAQVFENCDHAHRVTYWEMLGAGHTWAGAAPFPFDLVVGPTAGQFSATEVVLDFFDATHGQVG